MPEKNAFKNLSLNVATDASPLAPHIDGVAVAGADGVALTATVAKVAVAEARAESAGSAHILRLVAQTQHGQLACR